MRSLIIPGFVSLLMVAPVTVSSAPEPLAQPAPHPAPQVVYVNTAQDVSTGTRLLAAGAGAGLGFLASSYLLTTAVVPLTATALGSWGFSPATTGMITSSITTIGLVWGAYAGSVYGHDLVVK